MQTILTLLCCALSMLGGTLHAAQAAQWRDDNDAAPWAADRAAVGAYDQQVIQRRKYTLEHELFLAGEILPSDALYKGYCAHVAYAYHFSDLWAWEVAGLSYCEDLDTDLKTQLLPIVAKLDPNLPVLLEVTGAFATRLQLKPFYGKQTLRNMGLLHFEAFAQIGPALVVTRLHDAATRIGPGLDFGVGLRIWLGHRASARLDVTDLALMVAGTRSQVLRVDAGISIKLGGDR